MIITFNNFQSFIIGICIGSFLNVLVYRLPNNLSIIKPRSFCPKCKTKLTSKENIPLISWLIQRGKCIHCDASISIRYPLVELIMGILFVIYVNSSPNFYNSYLNLFFNIIFSWLFLSLLVGIALIDIESFWIPQGLINFGYLAGILNLVNVEIFNKISPSGNLIIKAILSSIISYFIFELIRLVAKMFFKKEAMGKGDSKLVSMMALWLGPVGIVLSVAITYVFASLCLVFAMQLKIIKKGELIPFAPFLSFGGLTVWYFGDEIILENILRIQNLLH